MSSRSEPEVMTAHASIAKSMLAFLFCAVIAPCLAQVSTDNIRRFDLRIENNRVTGGPQVITVRHGDAVQLTWSADRRTTLHLHGYDIEITVDRDKPDSMTFTARATGRFAIETHSSDGGSGTGRHRTLIYLEVHPR